MGFEKIAEVDSHLCCLISGLIADSQRLVETARAEAHYHRFLYKEPIPVKSVTQAVSDMTLNFGEGDKKKAGGNLMFRTAWTRVPEVQLELFVAALDDYEREHGDSTGFVRMLCEKRLP